MTTKEKLRCRCNSCHAETIHNVLYAKEDGGVEEFEGEQIHWGETWQLIQCRGCESISLRHVSWNSESVDYDGCPEEKTTYFPPRTFRELPRWTSEEVFKKVREGEIGSLVEELYVCLQNDCRASSAMLTRAIFEKMMIEKTGDHGSFVKNLDAFEREGYIGRKHRGVVESMLEAGHASIHRAFVPKKNDIVTLLDILEGVMAVVYVQTAKADELKKRIPKRHAPAAPPPRVEEEF